MPDLSSFDYAVIRVVPRVERGEFLNAGLIVFCRTQRYLKAAVELDFDRLRAMDAEIDGAEVTTHLNVIPRIAMGDRSAGPMSELPLAGRFHWLVSPRSTVIQISAVHCGLCTDPDEVLEHLMDRLVRNQTPRI